MRVEKKRSAARYPATPSSDLDHETKETVDGSGVLVKRFRPIRQMSLALAGVGEQSLRF